MLLTIPTTPEKGEFQTYTLDVSDLIALVTEEYYQDQENWRRVIVAYKSLEGNQLNLLSFTPDGGDTLTKQGFFAPESFSFFGIQSISIIDKQNGNYILTSNEIPDVSSYNIIFVNAGSAFFDMDATSGAWMGVSDDLQYVAVKSNYDSYYDARIFYGMVQNNTSAEINDSLTALVNNFKVDCYYFNADESKVYIAGRLGTNYLGETLPPFSVGSTYTTNPPRLISIDTVTLEVTFIADIKTAGAYSGMNFSSGSYIGNLVVDEDSNVAVMVGGGAVTGYNIVSGEMLWFKAAGFPDGNIPYRKVELYTAGSFLIGSITSYDGTAYTYYTPIKVNILTGAKDVSFPNAPSDTSGNTYNWGLTPDKTKVVQQGSNSNPNFFVFSGSSWSSRINYSGSANGVGTAMGIDNNYLYFVRQSGVKCDFTGQAAAGFSFSVPFYAVFGRCYALGANLYVDGLKFSSITGARDTSYSMGGDYYYLRYGQNDSIYYMGTRLSSGKSENPFGFNYASSVYGGYIGIINSVSKELVKYYQGAGLNPTPSYNPVFGPTGSNILFDGNQSATLFKATNFLTGIRDTTYPSFSSMPTGISAFAKDGDYMYVASQAYSDASNTFVATDLNGTYNLVTKLVRFNMVTKLMDTSFLPIIPSPFQGTGVITFTDDYIYLSAFVTGATYFYRINKSSKAVQQILPTTLGITSPATWNVASRIRVSKIATNKIVIYPDNSDLKFDGKPYVVCNEDTLSQTVSQPDVIAQFPRYYSYNSILNELGGMFYASDNTWHFISFNMSDNTKTTRLIVANSNNSTLVNSTGSALNAGNLVLFSYGDAYLTFSTGYYTSGFKPYSGVIRMNPLGIINNE